MTENMSLDSLQEEEELKAKTKANAKAKSKSTAVSSGDSAVDTVSSTFSSFADVFSQSTMTKSVVGDLVPDTSISTSNVSSSTSSHASGITPVKKAVISSSQSNENFFADFISGSSNPDKSTSKVASPTPKHGKNSPPGMTEPIANATPITRTPPTAANPSPLPTVSPEPVVVAASKQKTTATPEPMRAKEKMPEPVGEMNLSPTVTPASDSVGSLSPLVPPVPSSHGSPSPALSSSSEEAPPSTVRVDVGTGGADTYSANKDESDSLAVQYHQLQAEMSQKNTQYSELQSKYSAVCDKFKDTVKKLSEVKETFKSKCRSYDEEILQYRDSLNTKEFAHMGLQERFFLLEKQVSGKDMAAIQSKARIADLEEELAVKTKACQDKDAAVQLAEEQCKNLEASYLELQQSANAGKNQYDELLAVHRDLTAQHTSVQDELANLKEVLQSKASDTTTTAQQISTMQETIDQMRAQLEENAGLATQFQEYKKRAQQALKQANSTVAENSSSLQLTHEASLRRLQAEIAELTENNQLICRQKEQLAKENKELSEQQRALEKRVSELVRELEDSSETLRSLERKRDHDHHQHQQQQQALPAGGASTCIMDGMLIHEDGRSDYGRSRASSASMEERDVREPVTPAQPTSAAANEEGEVVAVPSSNFSIGGDSEEEEEEAQSTRDQSQVQSQGHLLSSASSAAVSSIQQSPVAATAPTAASPAATPGTPIVNSSQLFVVYQLQQQLQSLRNDFISRGQQCDELQRAVDEAEVDKEALRSKNAELNAFLSRIKQQLDREKDTETNKNIINFEYLKNCVYVYMSTTEKSEKRRLTPVIATILKFTDKERESVISLIQSKGSSKGNNSAISGTEDAFTSLYSSMFGQS